MHTQSKEIGKLTIDEFLQLLTENDIQISITKNGSTVQNIIHNTDINAQKDQIDIVNKITELLHSLDMPVHLKGYKYIRSSILLALEDITILDKMTKVLYPTIAKQYGTTSPLVEHAIRNAIEAAWNSGNIKNIEIIFGYTICSKKGRPTNSEFLALLTDYLNVKYFQ